MVSPLLREVKTASGATAVQIAVKEGRRDKVIEHLGSAHTQAGLAALTENGRHRIVPDQLALDLPPCGIPSLHRTTGQRQRGGGLQALSPVVGRCAQGVYPPGTGRGGRW